MITRRGFLGLPLVLLAGTGDDRVAALEADVEELKEVLGLMFGVLQALADMQTEIIANSNRNAVRFDQRLDVLEARMLRDVPDSEEMYG